MVLIKTTFYITTKMVVINTRLFEALFTRPISQLERKKPEDCHKQSKFRSLNGGGIQCVRTFNTGLILVDKSSTKNSQLAKVSWVED